jgi:chorismate--pyruvate lyase
MQNRPTWLPEPALPDLTTDPLQTSWLSERGSLTARLRATWGAVSVDVIDEGLDAPLAHEAARLGMPAGEAAWVRCVWLRCHGQARIHARTVIPRWGPRNPWVQVQQLGRQPLGELLFRTTDLQRGAFEWCADADWPSPDRHAAGVRALARRCLFRREGAPLLLTEVFLDMNTSTPR